MSKKKLIIIGSLGVTALIAFGALFTHIANSYSLDTKHKLAFAMSLLDEGRWDVAGRLARDLEQSGCFNTDESSAWHYIQGVSKLQSAEEELDSSKNRQVLKDATQHLMRAEELGFPPGYTGKGGYYLGHCLYHTYRWDDAIQRLAGVPELWPERRSNALRMELEAQLRKRPADFAAAQKTLETWNSIPGLSVKERARINLAGAHLQFALHRPEECENLLVGIGDKLPEYFEALIWRGRWRLEQAADDLSEGERAKLAQETEAIFRKVIVAANTPTHLRRQAAYLSGRNLRKQGRTRDALSTFSGVRQRSPHSAEAIASGIEEVEILMEMGDLDEAVETTHHVLRNVGDMQFFNEYWLAADDLKLRLLQIGRHLRDRERYEQVIRLADYISIAFPLADSVRLQAETYEQWAEQTAKKLGDSPTARSANRHTINAHYLLAAEKFEQLAQLELRSSDYPETLWHTIENYQRANELTKANALLADYLRFEDRFKRPRGLLALGRNHMHAGQWTRALEPLERCLIEYPTNPVSYEARLLAAQAKGEMDELDQSIELLEANLRDYQLDPKSQIWQDSLFELGRTLFRRGDQRYLEVRLDNLKAQGTSENKLEQSHDDFIEAIQQLREALSRYPEDPRYFDSRYLVANSYRLAAEMPEQVAGAKTAIVESARRQLLHKRRELLELALEGFRSLHQTINGKQDAVDMSDSNLATVRNCYFGEADTLFELERWEEAIQAYRNAASRFLNQPESLEALVQMATCHRKMGREAEAKKTLGQAEQVLRRIPAEFDTHFVSVTRANRQEWEDLLGWLKKWN